MSPRRLILLGALILAGVHARAADPVGDLLARVAAAAPGPGVEAEFRETKTLALLRDPVVETGTLAYLRPEFFRRTVTAPVPSTTLFDGESLWVVFSQERLAERYPARANRSIRDSLAGISAIWDAGRLRERFDVEVTEANEGHVLRLTPRDRTLKKSLARVEVTLGADLRVREIRLETADGNRSRIEILRQQAAALTPRDFAFDPAAEGCRVVAPLGTR